MELSENKRKPSWFPAIDGLRALAVLAVLAEHWCYHAIHSFTTVIKPGRIGVSLFFVISGFLITGILLDSRDKAARESTSIKLLLKNFYIRRILRIFPLYYLVIFTAAICGIAEITNDLGWNVLYLSNIRDSLFGQPEHYQHFWSLCIEEQFYIIWPIALMIVPRKMVLALIVAGLAMHPIYVLGLTNFNLSKFVNACPIGCFHTLIGGALLAWMVRNESANHLRKTLTNPFCFGSVFALYIACLMVIGDSSVWSYLAHHWLMAICLVGIVGWSALPIENSYARTHLSTSWLRYIGKISYCIYIVHPFVPPMVRWGFAQFDLNTAATLGKFQLPVFLIVTLILASISWLAFENPINGFKKHFPYVKKRQPARSELASTTL